jgi:DMSO/TMAO reductase YedYZ molybdopterin-dependent catalytic subunit
VQRRQSPGLTQTAQASVSFAPLQSLFGIVTPSGLHFERHHQGWWDVDPSKHRLMINGSDPSLLKTPKVFTMDEVMRCPRTSRFHFIECGANTGMEWGNVAVPTVQYSHGMLSCSEFTGVPLRILLDQCGVDYKRGRYVLAEGADGSSMTRTIPMELVESGEVLVAYGQNGEMLRPENGYPLRLVVPGVQGVSWVKYLRRIEVGDKPWGTKDEAIHYMDLMPDGTHRQYSSIQECKSVVTTPSGGQVLLDKGSTTSVGLAWSGRGKIAGRRVGRRRPQLAPRAARAAGDEQVPDALQHRLGLGRQAGHRAEPRHRRHRLRAAHLPPATARGARHALDLSQQRDPVLAGAGKRRGEECPAGLSPSPGALALLPPSGHRGRRPRRRPTRASAAPPRQGDRGLGHRRAPRLQGPAQGLGSVAQGRTCGRPSAPPATASSARATRSSRRWSAAPPPTT